MVRMGCISMSVALMMHDITPVSRMTSIADPLSLPEVISTHVQPKTIREFYSLFLKSALSRSHFVCEVNQTYLDY